MKKTECNQCKALLCLDFLISWEDRGRKIRRREATQGAIRMYTQLGKFSGCFILCFLTSLCISHLKNEPIS